VKFDFLGLKTLTVLRTATDLIARRGVHIDLSALPLDDRASYEMLQRGETVGVFQVESAGMRKALVEMETDRFEDIIALVALYRPGPMANIPVYCARKLGKDDHNRRHWYPHPKLEPVLSETFGIIVYQEQVMEVARVLSGYSLGDADLLRRAMGKKIKSEMDAQRERFVTGALEGGLDKSSANEIFDLLAKFADYGFNKSHAAAYALVAFQTAYLKANHPTEFLAASMTLDLDNTDKLSEFRREAQRIGITVEPPSINRSGVVFDVEYGSAEEPEGKEPGGEKPGGKGAILYALAAIKGVGRHAIESVVAARGDRPFRDLADFARRINPRLINKRTLENLVAAGAFDEIEPDRARACASVDAMMSLAQQAAEAANGGMSDMFGGVASADVQLRIPAYDPWPAAEKLRREYDAVGFFLSGHPLDEYASLLPKLYVQSWADFCRSVKSGNTAGRVAATVLSRQERRTKTGNKMGIVMLSDQSGHFEAIVFSEGLSQLRDVLEPGNAVVLMLQAGLDGDEVRARIQMADLLETALARHQKGMRIFLRDERPLPSVFERLKARGEGDVHIVLILDDGDREVEVKLPGKYMASPQIAGALRAVPGVVDVHVS
jgi:DNA polymerase-3 subunit alpha